MGSNRTTMVIVLAVVMMVLVMAGAVVITLGGIAGREKLEASSLWSIPAESAASMNVTDLTGDKQRDIFVQDTSRVLLLNDQGQVILEKQFQPPLASTQGDINGDGVPDIIVYAWTGEGPAVTAFTGQDETLWQTRPVGLGRPGRATAIDFDGDRRSEIVVGDESGQLVALSAGGETLWNYTFSGGSILRGLDDVALPQGGRAVTAGSEGGEVVVLDRQGAEMWRTTAGGGLRRLRSFPLGGPQNGFVFIGSVAGELVVYPGAGGQPVWSATVGQAVNEVRPVEIDGDPATTEVMVGGKDGGVWAFSQAGQKLWTDGVGSKVNEIVGLDSGTGRDIVAVGNDSGTVTLFDAEGLRLTSLSVQGIVSRLDTGQLAGAPQLLVADSGQVVGYTLAQTSAPFWYSPILGGLLASGAIAVVAYVVASMKPAPVVQVSAAEMTVEAQKARRRMLYESIQDLKKMQGHQEVSADAYLARLKDLRQQLADVNAALIRLGEPIKVETFTCPHCGGSLELGTDRCEYCGHVVIA